MLLFQSAYIAAACSSILTFSWQLFTDLKNFLHLFILHVVVVF